MEILHLSIVKISVNNKFFEIKWQLGNIKYLSLKYYKFDKRFLLCVSEYDMNLNYNIGINNNYETFIDIYTDIHDYYSSVEQNVKKESKYIVYNLIEINNFVKNLIQQIGKKEFTTIKLIHQLIEEIFKMNLEEIIISKMII